MNPDAVRRALTRLAAVLALVVLPVYAIKISLRTDFTDFSVYRRAAERAGASRWNEIYSPALDGRSPFRYSPVTLPGFSMFGLLPAKPARLLWYFLMYACFAGGFWRLGKIARLAGGDPAWAQGFSLLFVLRFCLDSFTSGQVTGLMFLCMALALEASLRGRAARYGGWILLPAALKVGPGILFFHPPSSSGLVRAWAAAAGLLGVFCAGLLFQTGSWPITRGLWSDWWAMLASDSTYFDSSHYGSQSIHSAILRWGATGGWSGSQVGVWSLAIRAGVTCGVLAFWALRKPRSAVGTVFSFSLGVFVFLTCMPATFKYSLPLLAFPVAALVCRRTVGWEKAALTFGLLVLSLGGLDLVGSRLFFWLQRESIPVIAMLFLMAVVARGAIQESGAVVFRGRVP